MTLRSNRDHSVTQSEIDDFEALLDASSLGSARVKESSEPLPPAARVRLHEYTASLRAAVRDSVAADQHDALPIQPAQPAPCAALALTHTPNSQRPHHDTHTHHPSLSSWRPYLPALPVHQVIVVMIRVYPPDSPALANAWVTALGTSMHARPDGLLAALLLAPAASHSTRSAGQAGMSWSLSPTAPRGDTTGADPNVSPLADQLVPPRSRSLEAAWRRLHEKFQISAQNVRAIDFKEYEEARSWTYFDRLKGFTSIAKENLLTATAASFKRELPLDINSHAREVYGSSELLRITEVLTKSAPLEEFLQPFLDGRKYAFRHSALIWGGEDWFDHSAGLPVVDGGSPATHAVIPRDAQTMQRRLGSALRLLHAKCGLSTLSSNMRSSRERTSQRAFADLLAARLEETLQTLQRPPAAFGKTREAFRLTASTDHAQSNHTEMDILPPSCDPAPADHGNPVTAKYGPGFVLSCHRERTEGQTVLWADFTVRLVTDEAQPQDAPQVPTRITYRSDDPYALELRFGQGNPDEDVTWVVGRELVADGLGYRRAGNGDVHVWSRSNPQPATRGNTYIELCSPEGRALLLLDRGQLRHFLCQSHTVVAPGTEHLQIQSALNELEAQLSKPRG